MQGDGRGMIVVMTGDQSVARRACCTWYVCALHLHCPAVLPERAVAESCSWYDEGPADPPPANALESGAHRGLRWLCTGGRTTAC